MFRTRAGLASLDLDYTTVSMTPRRDERKTGERRENLNNKRTKHKRRGNSRGGERMANCMTQVESEGEREW